MTQHTPFDPHARSDATHNVYHAPTADMTTSYEEEYEYNTEPFYAAKGRIGRLRYLAYTMVYSLIFFPVVVVSAIVMGLLISFMSESVLAIMFLLIYIAITVVQFYGAFALAVRRLNDVNKTGWLSLLLIIPLVNLVLWLYLVFAPGDDYVNDYGAPAMPPSTRVKIVAGLLVIIPFVMGILAAIALPAYQNYVDRSQQLQSQIEQQHALHD